MKYTTITGLMIVLLALTAHAQNTMSLTIDQAVQIGLENSKALRTSRWKVQAAEAKVGETDALGLPSLKFQGAYTRLSEVPPSSFPNPFNPVLPPIEISPSIVNNYSLKATVLQPIFTGFKISSAEDIAEYNAEAQKEDFKKDKSDLIYNVKNAYWNLYKAIAWEKVVDENVAQIQAHVTDAENFLKQGMLTNNDVLKVQVQLSDAHVRQIDAKNNVQLATIMLNNTLGLPLSTQITLASSIQPVDRRFGAVDSLLRKAFQDRPEIVGMNFRIKAGEAGVTAARSGWWPQIALVGNYNYLRPNQRIFPAQDKFKDTWDVSVAVSFDIWNWNTTGHQTTQAQAQLAQAEETLSMLKDGVSLEVTQNYLNVQQSKERIAVSEQGVAHAEENYRITNEKYKKGVALNSDLLDAEVALLQAKLINTQSLVDYELAMARLAKAIGE